MRAIIALGKFHGVIEAHHTDRLFEHDDALVGLVARNDVAIDPLGFFREPLDEACAIEDFALGLGQRLAHFRCQDRAQVVGIGDHQVIELAQHRSALLAGFCGPVLLRHIGCIDRGLGLIDTEIRQGGNQFTG
ncbi:MAG: hypothetical protein HoeaKO_40850 [Hoeflea alexandrii]